MKMKKFLATNLLELREKQFSFSSDLFEVTLDLWRTRNEYEMARALKYDLVAFLDRNESISFPHRVSEVFSRDIC